MKIFAETSRLILRELMTGDDAGMFALDSDPEVHKYLGNNPVKTIEESREVISFIRRQYIDNGIGRWAVIEKSSDKFIGWAGLKLVHEVTNNHSNYYDMGYRLQREFWGKGFATEAALASLNYGFNEMGLEKIIGVANVVNVNSINVLKKCGMKFVESFVWKNTISSNWYELNRADWNIFQLSRKNNG